MSKYTEFAKKIIETYVREAEIYEDMELKKQFVERAACFVSIHLITGELRGCIGTIIPYEDTLYEELQNNAISAATRDPRFLPIKEGELPNLKIKVDVLSDIKEVKDMAMLNPKIHGIIVEKMGRRGLLLPNLEGIDSLEQQITIAKEKAGLSNVPNNEINLSYFTVERYE